jgi:hypothetical protein
MREISQIWLLDLERRSPILVNEVVGGSDCGSRLILRALPSGQPSPDTKGG